LNRRPHPYQRENLTFSSRFSSIKPYSLHFNYYLPLFSRRFSAASTAVCGCLCGQKAFPPKTLGCRESLFLFTVYLCQWELATYFCSSAKRKLYTAITKEISLIKCYLRSICVQKTLSTTATAVRSIAACIKPPVAL